jgi:hypothetical protein
MQSYLPSLFSQAHIHGLLLLPFTFLLKTQVHRCLAAKLKESPLYPHSEMCHIALTMDAIRAELGVTFPADDNKPSVAKKQKA